MKPDPKTAEDICNLIRRSNWHMEMLHHARTLDLPDWAIGAGFVRAMVWDALAGHETRTTVPDLDLIYFDPADMTSQRDEGLRDHLNHETGSYLWDVKNQARMHLRNNDAPYTDTTDALANWLETSTCIAIRLEHDDTFTLLAPHGLKDLLALRVRPTPAALRKPHQYRERMDKKNWPVKWPGLVVYSV